MSKKLISLISPCFNEAKNIEELYRRASNVMNLLTRYDFEYVFIDNASTDDTVELLKSIARNDERVKIIVNNRNFGHIRSPYWGVLQTSGEATVYLASDLQDPPEMIPGFISCWENGSLVVLATKPNSKQNIVSHSIRKIYYRLLNKVSDITIIKDSTGFGLYDKVVIEKVKEINDPYPFFRGLIQELGYPTATINFEQPTRRAGISKNNFYALYDIAMLGLVSHSRVPLHLASFIGFIIGFVSVLSGIIFLILKLLYWEAFPMGIAPIMIVIFLMFGIIMFFIGILGEYIGSILTNLQKRPIVVERERVGFKVEK